MLGRPGGLSSLRGQHRRRRRARRQFLPDEGRDPGLSYGVVRKSGQAGTPHVARAPVCVQDAADATSEMSRRLTDVRRAENEGKTQEASIYRFMIDRKHQGKGYGRAALSKARGDPSDPGVNRISIRYMPENPVAKPFYASFGFVEGRRDRDGEVIAVLKL